MGGNLRNVAGYIFIIPEYGIETTGRVLAPAMKPTSALSNRRVFYFEFSLAWNLRFQCYVIASGLLQGKEEKVKRRIYQAF